MVGHRFDIGHAASYLFVTRDVCISREIFEMLRELEGSSILPDLERLVYVEVEYIYFASSTSPDKLHFFFILKILDFMDACLHRFCLYSWEHTQLTLLEKLVLGSMKSNLLMYFLAFFCTGGSAGTIS